MPDRICEFINLLSATTLKLSVPKLSSRCISTAILPADILQQRDQMSVQHQKEHL